MLFALTLAACAGATTPDGSDESGSGTATDPAAPPTAAPTATTADTTTTTTTTTTTIPPTTTTTLPTPELGELRFGFAVSDSSLDEPLYAKIVADRAAIIAPENAMKWENIHPARGEYDFVRADAIVEFAAANGLQVRGHPLIWHNQLPAWVTDATWDREGLVDVMRSHITRIVKHFRDKYPGVVTQWDVVNEAFTSDGERRSSVWQEVIGDDYIELAFQFAREADPDAALFYNDFFDDAIIGFDDTSLQRLGASADRSSCDEVPKCAATRTLAARFVDDGVPLDGIGFQAHVFDLEPPDYIEFASWVGPLGLQWALTEMDVGLRADNAATDTLRGRQADVYVAMVTDCLEAPNCNTAVVWGVDDSQSWIPDATDGTLDAALLFDDQYQPKPAASAVFDLLATADTN